MLICSHSTASYESSSRPCLFEGLFDGDPGLSGYCESALVIVLLASPDMRFLRVRAQRNAVRIGMMKAIVEMVQQAMANHAIPVAGCEEEGGGRGAGVRGGEIRMGGDGGKQRRRATFC